ncbi:hypothetical protein EV421DRAFT_1910997 [Armillaria borealis]|uniref:Uncharacterized protein n=1 Tax=Armillaria borealis TaxID=47425 RepID=A0AA39J081_9AGAR|nr:hypothetical protein EV421DRAFT_1910997 [Armillaria borealis]
MNQDTRPTNKQFIREFVRSQVGHMLRSWNWDEVGNNLPSTVMFSIIKESWPIDMIRFSLTSYGAHEIVTDFMQKAFLLQQSTRLLASGSCGVSFLLRKAFAGADFDVFVHSMFFDEVEAFLKKAGYGAGRCLGSLAPTAINQGDPAFSNSAVVAVYEYVNSNNKKIQVILCSHTPLDVLLSFHSSTFSLYYDRPIAHTLFIAMPMNFVSHDRTVSLYPRATFNLSVNYERADSRLPTVAGCLKYAGCGWLPANVANTQENTDHRDEERCVGDRYCWVIPLLLDCVPSGTTQSIASHTWKLSYTRTNQGWSTQYSLFKPEADKPSYCISESVQTALRDSRFTCSYMEFPSFVRGLFAMSDTTPSRIPSESVASSSEPSDDVCAMEVNNLHSSLLEESSPPVEERLTEDIPSSSAAPADMCMNHSHSYSFSDQNRKVFMPSMTFKSHTMALKMMSHDVSASTDRTDPVHAAPTSVDSMTRPRESGGNSSYNYSFSDQKRKVFMPSLSFKVHAVAPITMPHEVPASDHCAISITDRGSGNETYSFSDMGRQVFTLSNCLEIHGISSHIAPGSENA